MINCELLAPAGGPEALIAAVNSGADAVYLGGNAFNARASANNFDDTELEKAVDYCHLRKVRVYVVVNILISDKEFSELDSFIRKINKIGVDGVIVQDIGVAMYIKSIAPDLRLHASTQMTVYDKYGASFLEELDFDRVVLARELSTQKIKDITSNNSIETEIFVHGAMCVCYSGQCLMSSMIGGRSGNRGKCAQPCRLLYKIADKKGYLLSLKDMCLINHLKEIEDINVTSLKIEGRMKGPDYVGTVVSTYRKYLNNESKVSAEDYKQLDSIFYRGGLSDGYYTSKKGADMFCHSKPDNPYLKQDKISLPQADYKKTRLDLNFEGFVGKKLHLVATDEFGNCVEYYSEKELEEAKNSVASESNVKEKLSKLGDTVFEAQNIEINMDSNVFIPVSEINTARRNVTERLQQKIVDSFKRTPSTLVAPKLTTTQKKHNDFKFSVSVSTKEQLEAIRKTDCNRIYVPLELSEYCNGDEIIILPRISPDNLVDILKNIKNEDVLVTNIGQLQIAKMLNKNIYIDFTMNVFNKYSCDFYSKMNVKGITLSTELTISQIRDITPYGECEAVIYGKLPLMITENCMIKSSVGCKHGGYISDRTNERFLIKCLPECRNEIYNSKPIMMSDKTDDLKYAGLSYGRLYFVDEKPENCVKIYNMYKQGFPLNIDFTRGKFYKGV